MTEDRALRAAAEALRDEFAPDEEFPCREHYDAAERAIAAYLDCLLGERERDGG